MDRRTLLAFLLIFLVWLAYVQWMGHETAARKRRALSDSTLVAQRADSARAATGEPSSTPSAGAPARTETPAVGQSQIPAGSAEQPVSAESVPVFVEPAVTIPSVRVRTPLYQLQISNLGARIVSWQSVEFKNKDGDMLQLIPDDARDYHGAGDELIFSHEVLELGDVSFAVEGPAELDLEATSAESRVAFVARTESGLVVRKVFTFVPGRYDIGVQLSVGTAESSTSAAALQAAGEPQRARFSWTQGIASTEPNKKWEDAAFRSFAMVGDELEFKKRISMRRDISRVQGTYSGSVRFAGLQNKYFHIAGMVYHEPGNVAEGQIHLDGNSERGQQTWWIEIPLRSQEAAVGDRAGAVMHLYLGPSDFDILKAYGQGIEKTVDLGRTLTRPLSEAVLAIMEWTYRWIPNYGAVIILISVLIKVLFYPLTRASTRSMKRMQEVQPKLKALQEKYKNNREKLSQETMKLYREEKINPMAGCLPLVIQMPVFFALYDVLTRTIALRQAPFVFWIKDMAQPDALFKLPFSLPILGDGFNVLPILMAAAMYWQSKLTPTSAGGQMAALNSVMPLMMLVFFYNLPSGLVLYWLVNNVLTIYQTWKIHRSAPTAGGAQPA